MDPTVSPEPSVTGDEQDTVVDQEARATETPTVIDPPPVVIDHVDRGPIVIEQRDSPELLAQMANQPRGWYVDPRDSNRQRFWSGREFLSARPAPAAADFTPDSVPEPKPQGPMWKISPPSQVRSLLALLGLVAGGAMIVVAVYKTADWTTAVGLVGGILAAISCVMLGYSVSNHPDDAAKGSKQPATKKAAAKKPAKSKRK